MSMTCPHCGTWTTVKETRTRKTDGVVTRRYECANLHRFSTEERIRDDFRRASKFCGNVIPVDGAINLRDTA
jgi:transcriptional regulator NrdR family protein